MWSPERAADSSRATASEVIVRPRPVETSSAEEFAANPAPAKTDSSILKVIVSGSLAPVIVKLVPETKSCTVSVAASAVGSGPAGVSIVAKEFTVPPVASAEHSHLKSVTSSHFNTSPLAQPWSKVKPLSAIISRPEPEAVVEESASSADGIVRVISSALATIPALPEATLRVVEPPSDTDPPLVRPVPAVTVTEELAKPALATVPKARAVPAELTRNT